MTCKVRFGAACAAAVLAALLSGCGSVQFKGGAPFDTDKLETVLKPGVSTRADVEAALGKPYGKGGGYLPFHEGPRTTWTYFDESGSMDLSSGSMTDKRTYLFVFFNGDKFDSYMWFNSALSPTR
jgi:hypothetical protein